MIMQEIKQKLLQELKKDIPDLVFIYDDETLKILPLILDELLEKEKDEFNKKLEIRDEDIHFKLFDDDSELWYLFWLLHHFHSVNGNDTSRKIIANFEPKYMDFWNEVQYNKRYYEMFKICVEKNTLDEEQTKILTDVIKSFEVKWINLPEEKQEELKTINKKLSDLSRNFSENELDSENLFSFHSENVSDFLELPEQILLWAKEKAQSESKKGYLFGSSPSEYIAIMKYCSNSEVRKYFYTERNKIASSGEYDNRPIVLEILTLKEKKATILGFKNYAELSLHFKMAESVEKVNDTLTTVARRAENKGHEEINELKAHFWLGEIKGEDMSYYFRRYKEEKYSIDEKEIKKYLEFYKCLKGLFDVTEKLYGITAVLRKDVLEKWSGTFLEDTYFYEMYKDGVLLSYFVIDPFYRVEKRWWAWKNTLRDKHHKIVPIVINVYNIQKQDDVILIDFRELDTIFHEFWHAIHEMFSESKYSDLSWSHVEWDFVEVPSQFHEHFCHEKEALDLFAEHFETWEKIPEKMLEKIKMAENFWNGNMYLTQSQFWTIDMMLHSQKVPKNIEELDDVILRKVNELSIIQKDKNYKMYCSFWHIFDGGYASWFYSYMWSEILELDIWKEFQESGVFNTDISKKYYYTILSQWSKKEAKQLFYDFKWKEMDLQGFFDYKWL